MSAMSARGRVGAGFIPALTPLAVIIPSTVPHGFYIFCGVRAGMNPAPTVSPPAASLTG